MPDTWEELARSEYAKPDEPISARASDLSKIGAPVAAFITAVLAAVGGWVADAPLGPTVIAVAIIIAVAVAGLFYVFAADFKSRAGVAVARFNNLSNHAQYEAKANEKVKTDARAEVEKAEAVSAARTEDAEKTKKEAQEAQVKADKAREAAEAKATEATKRIDEAEDKMVTLTAELTHTREQLRRCTEEHRTPTPPVSTPLSYLALGGVDAVAGGMPTKVYAIESAGNEVVRNLVRGSDRQLRWVTEAEVTYPGELRTGPP